MSNQLALLLCLITLDRSLRQISLDLLFQQQGSAGLEQSRVRCEEYASLLDKENGAHYNDLCILGW